MPLPPIDSKVLQENPGFAKLYSTLTNVILHPDGSTAHIPALRERAVVQEELHSHRLRAASHHLIECAIGTAAPPVPNPRGPRPSSQPERHHQWRDGRDLPELPEPLLDLLLMLTALLGAADSLSYDSVELLLSSPPLSDLESLLPDLTALISSSLHASALSLAQLAFTSTNQPRQNQIIPSLPGCHAALQQTHSNAQHSLTKAHLRALSTCRSLLGVYTQCLTSLTRSLEAKHGVIARSLELRASNVSLLARHTVVEAKNAYTTLGSELYSPEAMAALQNYAAYLNKAKAQVSRRLRSLQAELEKLSAGAPRDEKIGKTA
ncbi:hypothetical protein RJ55_00022 [Drechmeria coniospora]|nr:hypothetical protein RJ55_00022 [Drechmeria coniospora]